MKVFKKAIWELEIQRSNFTNKEATIVTAISDVERSLGAAKIQANRIETVFPEYATKPKVKAKSKAKAAPPEEPVGLSTE